MNALRAALLAGAMTLALLPFAVTGQSKTYIPPKATDGHADLQGIWTNVTVTPLERPGDLKDKPFFTPAEAAAFEKQVVERNNADRRDGGAEADVARAYNDAWYDRGSKVVKTLRTSLVVDPPDGRIPALLPEAQKRQQERQALNRGRQFDGPENRSLAERCLMWPTLGPPMLPSFYNNNYQIVQGPGYVAILSEMIHDVRMIPTDGRPHLPSNVRLWAGDARGRWEGNTLVVDTTNFSSATAWRGSSEKLHLVERFTRTDPDTLLYEVTVEDPSTWPKPWKIEVPMRKTEGPIYEYACQEGNYAMAGMLAGARAEEKK
jgi:hypothetical protein